MNALDQLQALTLGRGQVALLWLGQAGFALRGAGTLLLIDPFLSAREGRNVEPPIEPSEATGVDVVACSHEHWDHFDAATVAAVAAASPDAKVVVPRPIVDQVVALGIEPGRVIGAQPAEPVAIGSAVIHPVPARHGIDVADAYDFGHDRSGGLCRYLGYVVELNGVRIYHAGDTITYPDMARDLRELSVELALLPINGRDAFRERANVVGNMDAAEALTVAEAAGADVLVPMHYDMFDANPGYPSHLVDIAQRRHSPLTLLLPSVGRPFVYASARPVAAEGVGA
jgi:L-ascorbate 6-phosphate lactonase